MSIFGWFDTKDVDAFVKAIAADLAGRIPPPSEKSRKKITPDRLHNAHEALMARAGAFGRLHKLNWYQKSHLGNTFRWALTERGYDKAFVDALTHDLLLAISRSKDAAA